MKNLLFTLILLFAMKVNAQHLNKTIEDTTKHKQVLLNKCTREGLTSFPEFKESYDFNYGYYKPDSSTLKEVAKLLKDKKITIVLGTWCDDSKYQVANFLKIMDALKSSETQLTFIAVDGNKKTENGLIDNLNITQVPTFIFTNKKGVEIGRITETPKESLEKDMLKILSVPKTK